MTVDLGGVACLRRPVPTCWPSQCRSVNEIAILVVMRGVVEKIILAADREALTTVSTPGTPRAMTTAWCASSSELTQPVSR